MSYDERWRRIKIVGQMQNNPTQNRDQGQGLPQMGMSNGQAPVNEGVGQNNINSQGGELPVADKPKLPSQSTENREDEIIGGLKNALERGSDLQSAKRSFINAGYTAEEVEAASGKVPQISSKISKKLPDVKLDKKAAKLKAPKSVQPDISSKPEDKSASKGMVVALVIMGVLVVVGGVALYFFRDKLF